MYFFHEHEHLAQVLDVLSLGVVLGWIVGALPAIATGLTVIWTGLRIYESIASIRDENVKRKDRADDRARKREGRS